MTRWLVSSGPYRWVVRGIDPDDALDQVHLICDATGVELDGIPVLEVLDGDDDRVDL